MTPADTKRFRELVEAANEPYEFFELPERMEAKRKLQAWLEAHAPALLALAEASQWRVESADKLRSVAQTITDTTADGKDVVIRPGAGKTFAETFILAADILAEWDRRRRERPLPPPPHGDDQ